MLSTVGERLKKARKYAGMTQVDLAKAIDAKQGAISDLENGRNNSSTKLVQMAICTGVNAEWLSTGKGDMVVKNKDYFIEKNVDKSYMCPVYNYEQVKEIFKNNCVSTEIFEPVAGDSGKNTYWVVIEEDLSMTPEFKPQELILINPNLTPSPGDYVIATDANVLKVMLRKWRACGFDEATGHEYTQLIAYNPDYPTIDNRYTDFKIHGVAIEHRTKLR